MNLLQLNISYASWCLYIKKIKKLTKRGDVHFEKLWVRLEKREWLYLWLPILFSSDIKIMNVLVPWKQTICIFIGYGTRLNHFKSYLFLTYFIWKKVTNFELQISTLFDFNKLGQIIESAKSIQIYVEMKQIIGPVLFSSWIYCHILGFTTSYIR